MLTRVLSIAGLLLIWLATPSTAAAQKECERWIKLVDGEVREWREALQKRSGAEKTHTQEMLTNTAAKLTEARRACKSGHDKEATLMALDLWDTFVDSERQARELSLNSRLNILSLRADRLNAFLQKGWKPKLSPEAERRFLEEIDQFDRVLGEALKQALR
ncbi:MAG: hypothetical protein ACRERE_15605 [Candidatus Entotheonellia bacterium]